MTSINCIYYLGIFAIIVNFVILNKAEKYDEVMMMDVVVLVHIIYRHGDRNPKSLYPNDPYKNMSYWKEGLGQLTDVGKRQHYEFGQYLRVRYKHLLPATYNFNDIKVVSTDVDRTLMSAESNFAGLYPPVTPWIPGLSWQPIPVHTVPEAMDKILGMKKPCPRYEKMFKELMKSPELLRINEKYKQWYDYISTHVGEEIQDPIKLRHIYNTLYIENLRNLKLPDWTKKVFPEKMTRMSDFSFTLAAYNKELQRLKSGPLLGEMLHHMKDKSKGLLSPDRKIFMYSAHDRTVANLLMTLGVFDAQSPPYTAAVLLQLHRLPQNEYVVSILFRNDTARDPYRLQLPGCSMLCPLKKFEALTKSVIPENWELECQLSIVFENAPVFIILGWTICIICALVCQTLLCLYWM